jgi:hypothetical protein
LGRGTNDCEAATASACCGLTTAVVTRDGSLAAAVLAAVRGTLSERRPIVAGVPNLSTLAGARAGMVGVTLLPKEVKK